MTNHVFDQEITFHIPRSTVLLVDILTYINAQNMSNSSETRMLVLYIGIIIHCRYHTSVFGYQYNLPFSVYVYEGYVNENRCGTAL